RARAAPRVAPHARDTGCRGVRIGGLDRDRARAGTHARSLAWSRGAPIASVAAPPGTPGTPGISAHEGYEADGSVRRESRSRHRVRPWDRPFRGAAAR